MRTLLSQFCEEFGGVVRPLLDPLRRSADSLEAASEAVPARAILPQVRELTHQLQALADKVAGQQAYVLIFGPLKSGKSTLMNAQAAAYVSEVTCLPAYPCMVYVSHSDTREFVITRYNGQSEAFSDPTAMRMMFTRAHTELADRIREVEERGEDFDPGVHFPEAIRQVDVKVPAGDLQESGAVLVDTPGLYSRMKFGYDRMTREFRNTAACAVFVVKTDNLFLEQVFEEFNELLELFSRIFLVVNLDTTKQDLKPDGTLAPSLEREDPVRIIEAFENLSMSAPLKAAADEGRLRIYPVDLLQAAHRRLNGEPGEEDGSLSKQADFNAFLGDLTDYLNSTDYLVAFLGDSMRHAGSLLSEIRTTCESEPVQSLARQVEDLEEGAGRTERQVEVLQRLSAFDWPAAFEGLEANLRSYAQERSTEVYDKTGNALKGAIESWFNSDGSLRDLVENDLGSQLTSCQRDLAESAHRALRERVGGRSPVMAVPAQLSQDLVAAGIQLSALGQAGLEHVDPNAGVEMKAPRVNPERIPVKKGIWDWILFRSQSAVRKRLFGPPERPTNRIPKVVKAKRLGDPARATLQGLVDQHLSDFFPQALETVVGRIYADYANAVVSRIQSEVSDRLESSTEELNSIRTQLEEIAQLRRDLGDLEQTVVESVGQIDQLSGRYGQADPTLLNQPVELELEESDEEAPDEDETAEAEIAFELTAEIEPEESAETEASQNGAPAEEAELEVVADEEEAEASDTLRRDM